MPAGWSLKRCANGSVFEPAVADGPAREPSATGYFARWS
jgi:hypothetical protein